jgi:hypothetical protein
LPQPGWPANSSRTTTPVPVRGRSADYTTRANIPKENCCG